MTHQPLSSTSKPCAASGSVGEVARYTVTSVPTVTRDIDLFGLTTVRIDQRRSPDTVGAPVLYVSAFVDDAQAFAHRVANALNCVPPVAAPAVADDHPVAWSGQYPMPDFVEEVNFEAPLYLPENLTETNWKAWAGTINRYIDLATTSTQLQQLEVANVLGLRSCPGNLRAPIGRKLHARYIETEDQAA